MRYWQSTERRKLLRLALISSPILAMFRIMPVAIFNHQLIGEFISETSRSIFLPLLPIGVLSANFFLQWLVNIHLFTDRYEEEASTGLLRDKRRYVYSFTFSLLLSLIPVVRDHIWGNPIAITLPASAFLYPVFGGIANNLVILLFVHLVLARSNESRLALRNVRLEVSQLRAQQAQLKHQLQPHFLFNALYTLQLLIGKQPERAQRYLQRLSTFLRASLQHTERETITTSEELAFCQDYLELQKVRFAQAINYEVDIAPEVLDQTSLPIFTLQLLAENAIKHNAFSATSPLHLRFTGTAEGEITVENNLIPRLHQQDASSGIGLKNLSERFQLLDLPTPRVEHSVAGGYFRVNVPTLPL